MLQRTPRLAWGAVALQPNPPHAQLGQGLVVGGGAEPAVADHAGRRPAGDRRHPLDRRPSRTLHSTNTIESMISICRDHAGNLKRCQDATMTLRWSAAGMVEAGKHFRRVNGYLHLPALRSALEAEVATTVTGPRQDQQEVEAA